MAKAAKTEVATKSSKTTALTTWDEELAKHAQASVEQEKNTLFGNMFGTQGGILTFQGTPIPGNQMDVVIVDHIHEKAWYKEKFDPNVKSGPHCYAYSRDGEGMKPAEDAFEKQSETCASCPFDQMGSADTGRGKACREGRRLAVISADQLKSAESIAKAEVGFFKTPPTSIVAFATYVKGLASTAKRPPFAVITKIRLVPDKDKQFVVLFELVRPLEQAIVRALMEKKIVVEKEIMFKYPAPKSGDDRAASRKPSRPTNPVAKKANGKISTPPPAQKTTKSGARVSKF